MSRGESELERPSDLHGDHGGNHVGVRVGNGENPSVAEHAAVSAVPRLRDMQRSSSMWPQQTMPLVNPRNEQRPPNVRRWSSGVESLQKLGPRQFHMEVQPTIQRLLEQEDTDGDNQISIADKGPKTITLETVDGPSSEIRGTYMLASLLQELALAMDRGEQHLIVSEACLAENPIDKLSRMIRTMFWNNLTRRIDAEGLQKVLLDPKNRSAHRGQILYVPAGEPEMIAYYRRVAEERPALRLNVEVLPKVCTPEYVRDLNQRPGLLAIAMEKVQDEKTGQIDLRGIPFVVPGARFNELYNWDSYFIALGLLEDGRLDLAKGPVDHFIFEIQHYHKIMNGNRTYYLLRSQPPFFTDFTRRVYERMLSDQPEHKAQHKAWLHRALCAAIKEYHMVWMSEPRFDPNTGLSRYHPEGLGVPPETEASHFTALLRPYAEKYQCSVNEFTRMYDNQEVQEPDLDEYFRHDRAVRESGHDTSYRVERKCADLATIDLQSLLFKYERDIGELIRDEFDDELELTDEFRLDTSHGAEAGRLVSKLQRSAEWFERAAFRKKQVDAYCWNEGKGLYYDYNLRKGEQSLYESVTSFWTMWSGMASPDQAARMMRLSLRKFEVTGGLVTGTEESRGPVSLSRPNRQWDYPYALPPHQMLAWEGLKRYGYMDDARRLAYRWLYMITTAFVNFNGLVPEKFDAVALSHLVNAEYGNQGTQFAYVPREGFGWTNASFQVGLTYLSSHMRKAVAVCQHPDDYFANMRRSASFGKSVPALIRRLSSSFSEQE
ncbi:hypothetical protein MGL_0658 [Malassezia globosa CBS 7966]|uniref:Trehalase n=1 Tax=Malassezia globosa (strain ATCC MYA-4612 / CBS 7966) TaxID=425265 RepID=A8PUD0_MALGO|nr:uncharacterized protein MGL_0658 [Malassezia globosa CBS 7966]EDP44851.1 hypothetical protein MGL_0658 [Malassezia globosa CBS 7966]